MSAKIISAYSCCGKSYIFENVKEIFQDFKNENGNYPVVLDSESSKFSKIYKDGEKTNETNPDFPKNYINYIKENMDKSDYIFVSSHTSVRKALAESGIKFTLIVPEKSLLTEWMIRMMNRGDSDIFVNNQIDNWDEWLTEIEYEKKTYSKLIKLKRGQYISDVIQNV